MAALPFGGSSREIAFVFILYAVPRGWERSGIFRTKRGVRQYRVLFVGTKSDHGHWFPAADLGCPELIRAFEAERGAGPTELQIIGLVVGHPRPPLRSGWELRESCRSSRGARALRLARSESRLPLEAGDAADASHAEKKPEEQGAEPEPRAREQGDS
jgi:hypothetical protein